MTKIFKSKTEFLNRDDKTINGVSAEFAGENLEFEKQNKTNEGCWNCSRCSGCSDCSGLEKAGLVAKPENKSWFQVPTIPNIHQTVIEAVEKPDALNMKTWHSCDTTHCRAGWVVHLAGEKGRALEEASSTQFAAMQIYHASSKINVSPVRFFETNEVAMADIVRCAAEEKAAQ
jgi:hypothetical protein